MNPRLQKQREKNRKKKESIKSWLSSKRKYKKAKRKVNRTKEEQKYCSNCRSAYKDCHHYQVMEGRRLSPRKGIPNYFAQVVGMIKDADLYTNIRMEKILSIYNSLRNYGYGGV